MISINSKPNIVPLIIFILIKSSTSYSSQNLNLNQALKLAVEKSEVLKAKSLELKNSEFLKNNAIAEFLPKFDLYASQTYINTQNSSTTKQEPWQNEAGLSITENLYDNGKSLQLRYEKDCEYKISSLQFEQHKQQILLKAVEDIFNIKVQEDLLQIQTEELKNLKKLYLQIEASYKQGVKSNRDYLRIKSQVQQSEISLVNIEVELKSMQIKLFSNLGLTEESRILIEDINVENLDRFLKSNEKVDLIENQISELQMKLEQSKIEFENKSLWPEVNIKAQYSKIWPQLFGPQDSSHNYDPQTQIQAQVILTYRFFDWGSTSRQVQINQNKILAAQLLRQNNLKLVQNNFKSLVIKNERLKKTWQLNMMLLETSQKTFQSLVSGYQDGKVSYLELVTAVNDLRRAKEQRIYLLKNIILTQAELAAQKGLLHENHKFN